MAHLHKQHFVIWALFKYIYLCNSADAIADDLISDKNKRNKGLEGLNKHATCISKLCDTRLHQKHLPYN